VEIRSYADAMSIRTRVRKRDPGSPGPVFPTLQAVQGLHRLLDRRRRAVAMVGRDGGCSSAGRAPALQAGGHRFESGHLHQNFVNRIGRFEILVDCRGERLDSSCWQTSLSRASATEEWMQAGQATKGPRWMPRHQAPKKDAATCDKRRGVGSKR
jgi:hypothetical protein